MTVDDKIGLIIIYHINFIESNMKLVHTRKPVKNHSAHGFRLNISLRTLQLVTFWGSTFIYRNWVWDCIEESKIVCFTFNVLNAEILNGDALRIVCFFITPIVIVVRSGPRVDRRRLGAYCAGGVEVRSAKCITSACIHIKGQLIGIGQVRRVVTVVVIIFHKSCCPINQTKSYRISLTYSQGRTFNSYRQYHIRQSINLLNCNEKSIIAR